MLRAGSAQHRKAAGVEMVVGGLRVFLRLLRRYTYPEPSVPPPDPQTILNQQFDVSNIGLLLRII
jgi:hypothetical protein